MNTTGMSFGGGFASGLATILNQKRLEDINQRNRQVDNLWKSMGFLLDSGQVQDVSELQPHFDALAQLGAFGTPQKGKGPGPQEHVQNILGHIIRNQNGQPVGRGTDARPLVGTPMSSVPQGPTGPNDAGEMIPDTSLPSMPLPTAAPPPAPRPTLMGIPLLTPVEAAQQRADTQGAMTAAQVAVRRKLAEQLGYTGQDAIEYALNWKPSVTGLARPVPGEVTDQNGQRQTVFGVWEPSVQGFVAPDTHLPLQGFVPRSSTASTSYGADRNALALAEYGKPYGQLTQEQQQAVNAKSIEQAGSKAEATTAGKTKAESEAPLSSKDRFAALRGLQEDWRKVDAPVKETKRQYDLMQTGLKRFREGDKIGGSQAVLVTFQKILDPNSVVRESEYARTPEGLGLQQRMEGFIERLQSGGAGVPVADLEQMVQTAKEFVDGMTTYNQIERRRITAGARQAGLDPNDIFGDTAPAAPAGATTPKAATPGLKKVDGKWVISTP